MKQPEEELQETLTELDDRAVLDYLRRHPEFFVRNAHAVEAMRVPHPVRGTVSLVEWHMARARNHIHALEENMTLLMEQAHANESLFYRLLHLQSRLAAADSLDEMLMRFHRWAREQGLAGATLRLFPDRWRLGAPSRYTHLALKPTGFRAAAYSATETVAALSWPAKWPGTTGGFCRKRKRFVRLRCPCWP
ncbi:Protein of uncharacterised function DUF484 [Salmonella enterica subsp. arizonae]|uniref:Protein of uncharacterized function DUF484 n=1 Tax=Salmonella enterica subsp. arizonae TaxID=59203 RepID=A0A379T265_SALER|nr:Protein of uncharacterised function DUF484 [Salmonella enterica subsp. arizonae]